MASKKGRATLRGRFSPGTVVKLIRVEGAHVLRPPDNIEPTAVGKVDKDGEVSFPVDVGERYFISGIQDGAPLNVRITGRADDEPNTGLEQPPIGPERQRLADGSFLDEPPERTDQPVPDGATWPGQQHVSKGTVQRSETPRGAATPISAEELDAAQRGHRKQEPTDPVVETEDAEEAPARTARPPKRTTAHAKGAKK